MTRRNPQKTRDELIREVQALHQRITQLETLVAQHQAAEQALPQAAPQRERHRPEDLEALQREIAAHERVTQELHGREERYRALIENANDIVYTHTLKGRFTSLNKAGERIMGYTRQEIRHLSLLDLVAESHRDLVQRLLHNKFFEAPAPTFELLIIAKGGRHISLEINTQPIVHAGRVTEIQGTARDITERKRLEERLLEAQKMEAIGTLAGGIAHDFNNRLNAILGFTELALLGIAEQRPVEQHLQRVMKAGTLAKDLVQQILTFSRQRAPQRTVFPLSRVVNDTLRLIRASLPSTIEIRANIDEDAGMVLADYVQLQQMLLNFCSNAEYAMRPAGGVLEVHLEGLVVSPVVATRHPGLQPGPALCLTIRDTGHGMQPETLQRIFEPFFTTKEPGEGTGMGLAVVHGTVVNHGGTITVASTPGLGTTFEVYLPRLADMPTTVQASSLPPAGRKWRVLFVDDEETLVEMAQEMLVHLGHQPTVFTSSRSALKDFSDRPWHYDLVITDQTMPHMTGEMFAYELRRVRPDVPIILCTGYSHLVDETKATTLGINAFCMKPLGMQELAETIEQVMQGRPVPSSP